MSETKPRARDLEIPFEGSPGSLNAITDVQGVEVGHSTLVAGEGELRVGEGPVRTGVTAVLPRGRHSDDPVFAGWFSLNGNGEMTGTAWIEESGFLDGPIMITNTHSVGIVRDAVIAWRVKQRRKPGTNTFGDFSFSLPVVAETWDGFLNDINGFHVKPEHVFDALNGAAPGAVAEGNVGGGTGMICYGYKGGIGTASRRLDDTAGGHTVGVLAQCNAGAPHELRIADVPVGKEMPAEDFLPQLTGSAASPGTRNTAGESDRRGDPASIIVIVATDAPLLPHQLKRLARRASLGYGRTGSISHNGSGDLFIAFSTANAEAAEPAGFRRLVMLPNDRLNPLFRATVQAVEEAIANALVAAETMTGIDNRKVAAIPHDRLREVMKKYNR